MKRLNNNLIYPLSNKGYQLLKTKKKLEKKSFLNKQKGVSLISLTLASAIGIGVIISGMWAKVESNRIEKAELQGEILRDIATGLNNYIVQHHRQLLAGTPITKTENGVEIVIPMADPLHPTIAELEQLGLTKASVGTKNLYGGDYIMQIEFKPAGCVRTIPTDPTVPINSPNCDIEAVVAMTNPIMSKGDPNGNNDSEKLAGYAIKKMGSMGGFSSRTNPNLLVGIGGADNWSFNNPNGSVAGILAAKTNYTTSTLSYYLPRDGHLPMTDDLKLGEYDKRRFPTQFYTAGMNNSIKAVDTVEARYIEVQDLNVERDLTVGRHITAGDRTKIGQADQSLFNFYGKMNIGDENANISDAALLNVYGRSVFGKKGQPYTNRGEPFVAIYGDTNIGEVGNSILFNVYGDSTFNGYNYLGGAGKEKPSRLTGFMVDALGNQVVLDVDGNAAFNDSVGINKYLYVGNGVGKRSQILNADIYNDKVDTGNSVLDVNGNAVIGNNLKVLGNQLIDDDLYVGSYAHLGLKRNGGKPTELTGPAANALNQVGAGNVALDVSGNAMIDGSVGINKYLFVGDGTGNHSAIPGINQNTVLDVNGGLGVKDDAQILGNATIGTGNFGDGNKGNLNVTNKLTAYDAEIKNSLIAGSPGRGESTFYNKVTFADNTQVNFKNGTQTIFEPGSYVEFQGKVKFSQTPKPVYDTNCDTGEFGLDAQNNLLVCRNNKWDLAEPDGNTCGMALVKGDEIQKVSDCNGKDITVATNDACPIGYTLTKNFLSHDTIPVMTSNSRGEIKNRLEKGYYRGTLYEHFNPDHQGFLGADEATFERVKQEIFDATKDEGDVKLVEFANSGWGMNNDDEVYRNSVTSDECVEGFSNVTGYQEVLTCEQQYTVNSKTNVTTSTSYTTVTGNVSGSAGGERVSGSTSVRVPVTNVNTTTTNTYTYSKIDTSVIPGMSANRLLAEYQKKRYDFKIISNGAVGENGGSVQASSPDPMIFTIKKVSASTTCSLFNANNKSVATVPVTQCTLKKPIWGGDGTTPLQASWMKIYNNITISGSGGGTLEYQNYGNKTGVDFKVEPTYLLQCVKHNIINKNSVINLEATSGGGTTGSGS